MNFLNYSKILEEELLISKGKLSKAEDTASIYTKSLMTANLNIPTKYCHD